MTDETTPLPSARNLKPSERAEIDRLLDAAMKGEAVVIVFAAEMTAGQSNVDVGVVAANADPSFVMGVVDICLADLAELQDGNDSEDGKDPDDTKH